MRHSPWRGRLCSPPSCRALGYPYPMTPREDATAGDRDRHDALWENEVPHASRSTRRPGGSSLAP